MTTSRGLAVVGTIIGWGSVWGGIYVDNGGGKADGIQTRYYQLIEVPIMNKQIRRAELIAALKPLYLALGYDDASAYKAAEADLVEQGAIAA